MLLLVSMQPDQTTEEITEMTVATGSDQRSQISAENGAATWQTQQSVCCALSLNGKG